MGTRRRWAWIAGGFGLAAVLRGLTRRKRTEDEPSISFAPEPAVAGDEPDPRAEELRSRLDAAKAAGDDRAEFESGETPVDAEPDARRRDVHEEARAAIDEMKGPAGEEQSPPSS
jgi:hypothetical protein